MSGDEGEDARTPPEKDPRGRASTAMLARGKGRRGREEEESGGAGAADPFIRLARLGPERRNRCIRSVASEQEAKDLKIEGLGALTTRSQLTTSNRSAAQQN